MKNSKFKNIIVGVDFSEYSKVAVKQAIKLADFYDANLIFVHVINKIVYVPYSVEEGIVDFYKLKNLKNLPKIIVLDMNSSSDGIIQVTKKYKNAFIVIGHRGRNAVSRFFLGNTAESLALRAPCPVWVHRGNTVSLPHKVLLPCDLSERAKKSYRQAKDFSGGKAEFEFFHVQEFPIPILDATQYRQAMKRYMASEKIKMKKFKKSFPGVAIRTLFGSPALAIAKKSKGFDLIAMAPHNRKGLFSHFGSVTAQVVRNGNIPVLITR